MKCSTTQSLNSLSSPKPNFSIGSVYQHSAQKTVRHSKDESIFFCFTGQRRLWTRREGSDCSVLKMALSEKLYSFYFSVTLEDHV